MGTTLAEMPDAPLSSTMTGLTASMRVIDSPDMALDTHHEFLVASTLTGSPSSTIVTWSLSHSSH